MGTEQTGTAAASDSADNPGDMLEGGALPRELPVFEVAESDVRNELAVLRAFVMVDLVPSHTEAKKQLAGRGLRVNDHLVSDEKAKLRMSDVTAEGTIKLTLGRKRHVLLKPV